MPYKEIDGIKIWGEEIPNAVDQIKAAAAGKAVASSLMADHHHGYDVPIGSVMAYQDAISPAGVGFDIACGNCAVKLDISGYMIRDDMEKIMDTVWKTFAFGPGGKNKEADDIDAEEVWTAPMWDVLSGRRDIEYTARTQIGTIGGGNHYVDIFEDEKGDVWVGVHFGSRGFGHRMAKAFIKQAGDDVNALIGTDTQLGQDYLACMETAGKYAYIGREWVCKRVAKILDANIVEMVHNHHNFAWKENHFGEDLWIVRKGATPNQPGQLSFVGATMADTSYILQGLDTPENYDTMFSTIHGAGRIMSRTQAAGRVRRKKGKVTVVKEGKISRDMMLESVWSKGIVLRGAGTDEAPQAYKRLDEVLEYHLDTVRVVHKLQPMGIAMTSGQRESR